jgi:hypothetical protein
MRRLAVQQASRKYGARRLAGLIGGPRIRRERRARETERGR